MIVVSQIQPRTSCRLLTQALYHRLATMLYACGPYHTRLLRAVAKHSHMLTKTQYQGRGVRVEAQDIERKGTEDAPVRLSSSSDPCLSTGSTSSRTRGGASTAAICAHTARELSPGAGAMLPLTKPLLNILPNCRL